MKKFKCFIDIEKEEMYLNNMAREGYKLSKIDAFGIYHFEKSEKSELCYRIDYRFFKTYPKLDMYKSMFEDFGWKYVTGSIFNIRHVFVSDDKDRTEIFSTEESLTEQNKSIFLYSLSYTAYYVALIGYMIYVILYARTHNLSRFNAIPIFIIISLASSFSIVNIMRSYNRYKKCRSLNVKLGISVKNIIFAIIPAILAIMFILLVVQI